MTRGVAIARKTVFRCLRSDLTEIRRSRVGSPSEGLGLRVDLGQQPHHLPPSVRVHRERVDHVGPAVAVGVGRAVVLPLTRGYPSPALAFTVACVAS